MPPQLAFSAVGAANQATWSQGAFVSAYANRNLRPVEVLLLVRLRENLSGAVLELGCGAGRIAGYLVALAREFHTSPAWCTTSPTRRRSFASFARRGWNPSWRPI